MYKKSKLIQLKDKLLHLLKTKNNINLKLLFKLMYKKSKLILQKEKSLHHKKPKKNTQKKSLLNHIYKKSNNTLLKEKLLHHNKPKKNTLERRLFNLLLKMLSNLFISKSNQFSKKVLNQLYSKESILKKQSTKEHKISMLFTKELRSKKRS